VLHCPSDTRDELSKRSIAGSLMFDSRFAERNHGTFASAEGDDGSPSGRLRECVGSVALLADVGPSLSGSGKPIPSLRGKEPIEWTGKDIFNPRGRVDIVKLDVK